MNQAGPDESKRSAGRQCDNEGVMEVYIMLVFGTVLLNAVFMFLEI